MNYSIYIYLETMVMWKNTSSSSVVAAAVVVVVTNERERPISTTTNRKKGIHKTRGKKCRVEIKWNFVAPSGPYPYGSQTIVGPRMRQSTCVRVLCASGPRTYVKVFNTWIVYVCGAFLSPQKHTRTHIHMTTFLSSFIFVSVLNVSSRLVSIAHHHRY